MPRIVTLTPRFLSRARALGVRSGSPLSTEVGRVVRQLAAAELLPLAGDVLALIPPTREGFRAPRAWAQLVALVRREGRERGRDQHDGCAADARRLSVAPCVRVRYRQLAGRE